ncbi:MAG: T9SS type A sorting domain-containing protein [Ignavibacteriae bacterium]|nr:T9SS type A sorting domain-containing protein [Ignavibacteriota bacterium]
MIKILRFIIFLNIFILQILGDSQPSIVRIDFPEYVIAENSFEVSAVFKFYEKPSETFRLNFSKSDFTSIKSASILVNENKIPLKINYAKNDENFSISINPEKIQILENIPYQIIFICRNFGSNLTAEKFITYKNDSAKNNSNPTKTKYDNVINFYKTQEIAGNCLSLKEQSNFEIEYKNESEKIPLLFEFWFKTNSEVKNLFTIFDANSYDTVFALSRNELGFASTPFDKNDKIKNDVYIANSTWNYFSIQFKKENNGIKLSSYMNTKLMSTKLIPEKNLKTSLKFTFANSHYKSFEIDRIYLTKFGNKINLAFENKHFLNFDADSSTLICKFNFDEKFDQTNYNKFENIAVKPKDIELKKSSAPIFSRAPKLTVTMGSSYNSIIWYVQEFYAAKEFILEKSTNNSSFRNIFKTFADDDPLKIYYFTDDLLGENDIAFYRLKQINKDNTEVYSGEVKIGNKKIEEFKLNQNYPNPFNPNTKIFVDVIIPSEFEINVFDLVGNRVAHLHKGYLTEGLHSFEFNGVNLPSGIYFYEILSPHSHAVKKMILAK